MNASPHSVAKSASYTPLSVESLPLTRGHMRSFTDRHCVLRKSEHQSSLDSKFLSAPKKRYRAVLFPERKRSAPQGMGSRKGDNTPEGYEPLLGDRNALNSFCVETEGVGDWLRRENIEQICELAAEDAKIADSECVAGIRQLELCKRHSRCVVHGWRFSLCTVDLGRAALSDGALIHHIIETSLPCPDARFDLVLRMNVFEYLRRPLRVVEKLVHVYRPSGTVLSVVHDGDVDQIPAHSRYCNGNGLRNLLAPCNASVSRFPESQESLTRVAVSKQKNKGSS